MLKTGLFIICCIFAVQVSAFEAFGGAVLRSEQQQQETDHWVVLGAVERMKGAVTAEKDVRVAGQVESRLWQIPVGHGLDDVYGFYRAQGQQQGFETRYDCKGRSCGTSNDYANQVFHQSLLVARDADQRYWVGTKWDGRQWRVWLIYAVQKVNKGTLVYAEQITLAPGKPELFKITDNRVK